MKDIIQIAVKEIGHKEIPGSADNPEIVKYAQQSGFEWVNDDETPWCSIFMNWVAKRAGLKRTFKASARSWLHIGTPVVDPEPGDVVIFWREHPQSWKGHVGIFMGFDIDGERVYTLGGNQGNMVSIRAYSAETVLGFRRLRPNRFTNIPEPVLRRGNAGEAVKSLQQHLNLAHLDAGTVDGDFGPKTERAVKDLQASKIGLTTDGVYNQETRDHLEDVLKG